MNPAARTLGDGSANRPAEVVRLDAVRSRVGRDTALVTLAPAPGSNPPRLPAPTMATPPAALPRAANRAAGVNRLRAVAPAGDVPPTSAATVSAARANGGGHWPSDVGRVPVAIRVAPIVAGSAGPGVGATPGARRAVPRPPLIHQPDGLADSA